jgi:hypothetical protein
MSTLSSDVRSDVIFASTVQKLALLTRDQQTLSKCLATISSESLSATDDKKSAVEVDTLRSKAKHLMNMRLANDTTLPKIAENALDFLTLAEDGESVDDTELEEWNKTLDAELEKLRSRVEHAAVLGDVLKEWLDEQRTTGQAAETIDPTPIPADTETPKFTPDAAPPTSFDPSVFLKNHSLATGLEYEFSRLAEGTRKYGEDLFESSYKVEKHEVEGAIRVISGDARVYSAGIRRQIKELGTQPLMVDELASSFTSRWRGLENWEWPVEGIRGNLQRHMSGKERNFLNLDMYDAIFMEIIGQKWCVHFRDGLARIRESGSWPRIYSLQGLESGKESELKSLLEMLRVSRKEEAFVGVKNQRGIAQEDLARVKGEFASAMKSPGGYAGYEPSTSDTPIPEWAGVIDASRTAAIHSNVFRHMRADIAVSRELQQELDVAVFHGDLANFGPSVPHDVTIETLRYFGMPEQWLEWFRKYLKLPYRGAGGTITVAERGTPFGMTLSTVVNELLLVILDTALASAAGIAVHRQHDDIWIWSSQIDRVSKAWAIMNDFTTLTGLSWNEEKTGCTVIRGSRGEAGSGEGLPKQGIKWGVLILTPDGTWQPDEAKLEELAKAIKVDLDRVSSRSLLANINIWNKYHGYITRNVGPVTDTTAFKQPDLLRATLRRFQQLALPDHSTVHDTLISHFRHRFPQHETYTLTRAILEWPIGLGGFTLHPHLLHIKACEEALSKNTSLYAFDKELTEGKRSYERVCRAWESEWGDRAWEGYSGEDKRTIWQHYHTKPPIFDEATYLRWYALNSPDWKDRYERVKSPVVVSSEDISDLAQRLYRPWIEGFGLPCERLVSEGLVPKHAAIEVEMATREVFSAIAGTEEGV